MTLIDHPQPSLRVGPVDPEIEADGDLPEIAAKLCVIVVDEEIGPDEDAFGEETWRAIAARVAIALVAEKVAVDDAQ